MFVTAKNKAQALGQGLEDQLYERLERLDRATGWSATAAQVEARRADLSTTEQLCRRVADLISTEEGDAALLHHIGHGLVAQAKTLESMAVQLRSAEYETETGWEPRFSSRGLTDETHTPARTATDWNTFLAIEPREFVANNADVSAAEMRRRAYDFMYTATAGHGLSRKAKIVLAEAFLTEVSIEQDESA